MKAYALLPEPELVVQLQKGEQEAGEELYHRYHGRVENYCYQITRDRDAARDAVHDTFLAVTQTIGSLREANSFKAWLFRIARNNCLMAARRNSGQIRLEDAAEVWEDETPLTVALATELKTLVREAISHLKPVYREALILREFESMSYQEIADATGSSLATVKFRIHKARQALAESLGTYLDERNGK